MIYILNKKLSHNLVMNTNSYLNFGYCISDVPKNSTFKRGDIRCRLLFGLLALDMTLLWLKVRFLWWNISKGCRVLFHFPC